VQESLTYRDILFSFRGKCRFSWFYIYVAVIVILNNESVPYQSWINVWCHDDTYDDAHFLHNGCRLDIYSHVTKDCDHGSVTTTLVCIYCIVDFVINTIFVSIIFVNPAVHNRDSLRANRISIPTNLLLFLMSRLRFQTLVKQWVWRCVFRPYLDHYYSQQNFDTDVIPSDVECLGYTHKNVILPSTLVAMRNISLDLLTNSEILSSVHLFAFKAGILLTQ
jgi:hypothetical protein